MFVAKCFANNYIIWLEMLLIESHSPFNPPRNPTANVCRSMRGYLGGFSICRAALEMIFLEMLGIPVFARVRGISGLNS